MKTRELRAEARIPVSERGSLNSGDVWFPCMVLQMSDSGIQILCSKPLTVGQVLDLKCELFPGKSIECKIEIKHVSDSGMGAKITEIDKRGSGLVLLYLQEQYSLKLNKKS
jgi:hypothetical protein